MKLATLLFLYSSLLFAAQNYSEIRNAESKRINAIFEGVKREHKQSEDDDYQKALSEHTEALKRLSPVLLSTFPKFTFGEDYIAETDVYPNLFMRGDQDCYCYEGLQIKLTSRGKKPSTFAGHLTNESLLRDADDRIALEISSWHREKGTGVATANDATEVFTEIYCNGASHTQLKKLKNGLWVVQVTQDSAQAPSHLIGLKQVNENYLFLKTELPKSFVAKLTCPKKVRPEKAQIKCLSDELTDKLLEPHSKPLLQALAAFQIVP